jgi:chromosome segregation ATPase
METIDHITDLIHQLREQVISLVKERDELQNEVSNLQHDYAIVSAERNTLRELANEAARFIQAIAASTDQGITRSRQAEGWLYRYAAIERGKQQ